MALNDISLSAGMRANLKSLLSITPLLDRTQSRLATGKKVNNALDNPTNFFASQAHTQRTDDLSSRKAGIVEGIHSVNAADKGITAITSLIESANALVQSDIGHVAFQGEAVQRQPTEAMRFITGEHEQAKKGYCLLEIWHGVLYCSFKKEFVCEYSSRNIFHDMRGRKELRTPL